MKIKSGGGKPKEGAICTHLFRLFFAQINLLDLIWTYIFCKRQVLDAEDVV